MRVSSDRKLVIGVLIAAALSGAAWWISQRDNHVQQIRRGMTYSELVGLLGKPIWGVVTDHDMRDLLKRSNVVFDVPPIAGHCLERDALAGRERAEVDELPWLSSPRTAPQVWLFRSGVAKAILVYPGEDGTLDCALAGRLSH